MSKASEAAVVLVAAVAGLGAVACERKTAPPAAADPAPVVSAAAPLAPAAGPVAREGKVVKTGVPPSAGSADVDGQRQFARVEFPEVPIRAGATTTVHVAWRTPEGTTVNEDAPFKVRWNRSDALAEAPSDVKATGTAARDGFRIAVKPLDGAPNATLNGIIDIVVCDSVTHAVCVPVRRKVEIEFVVGKAAAAETKVVVELPQAKPQE